MKNRFNKRFYNLTEPLLGTEAVRIDVPAIGRHYFIRQRTEAEITIFNQQIKGHVVHAKVVRLVAGDTE